MLAALYGVAQMIVPTPVGVNRVVPPVASSTTNCPHARGGEPITYGALAAATVLSPRPWG